MTLLSDTPLKGCITRRISWFGVTDKNCCCGGFGIMRIREELSSREIGGTKVRTWLCDDPARGDNPKLRKGRPLERLCPGVVGTPNIVFDSKLKKKKMFGISIDTKKRCDCECHF